MRKLRPNLLAIFLVDDDAGDESAAVRRHAAHVPGVLLGLQLLGILEHAPASGMEAAREVRRPSGYFESSTQRMLSRFLYQAVQDETIFWMSCD